MAERWLAYGLSACVLALVMVPISWPAKRDSFPQSSYPMFARGRKSPVLHAVYAVAYDGGSERRYVPPPLVANREVLQARAVLDDAARRGSSATRNLCRHIAGRVAEQSGGWFSTAKQVAVIRGAHDAVRYFDTGKLGKEVVLARCTVEGR